MNISSHNTVNPPDEKSVCMCLSESENESVSDVVIANSGNGSLVFFKAQNDSVLR